MQYRNLCLLFRTRLDLIFSFEWSLRAIPVDTYRAVCCGRQWFCLFFLEGIVLFWCNIWNQSDCIYLSYQWFVYVCSLLRQRWSPLGLDSKFWVRATLQNETTSTSWQLHDFRRSWLSAILPSSFRCSSLGSFPSVCTFQGSAYRQDPVDVWLIGSRRILLINRTSLLLFAQYRPPEHRLSLVRHGGIPQSQPESFNDYPHI